MHVVVQVIHNQNREENHDENDGGGGKKDSYIPEGVFFMPHIDEKEQLDKRLDKSKTENY